MLRLTVRSGERVLVEVGGKECWVTILATQAGRVMVGFEAPPDVRIDREKMVKMRAAAS